MSEGTNRPDPLGRSTRTRPFSACWRSATAFRLRRTPVSACASGISQWTTFGECSSAEQSSNPHWDDRFQNWTYEVAGRDYDNVPLVIVVVIEPPLGRLTVITGKDD